MTSNSEILNLKDMKILYKLQVLLFQSINKFMFINQLPIFVNKQANIL
jgi:hypothetical protein